MLKNTNCTAPKTVTSVTKVANKRLFFAMNIYFGKKESLLFKKKSFGRIVGTLEKRKKIRQGSK